MTQDRESQVGLARIDPMSQPAYAPRPHIPPRDRAALRPIWQRILEAIIVAPDTGVSLAQRLGLEPKRVSSELSEMKARGLIIAEGGPPAIWALAPPGTPARAEAPKRRANTGLRARVRDRLLEGPRTVTDLLEQLPGVTRANLIDNLRKWRAEHGCYLHPVNGDLLVCLPDQPVVLPRPPEAPCPSPLASVAPPSTRTAPTPLTSPAGSAPASVPPAPTLSAGTPETTTAARPPPSSPTAAPASGPRASEPDLPSTDEVSQDPALRPLVDAYWALQRAVEDYADERLRSDPVWRALALSLDTVEAAIAQRRRPAP